MSTRIRVNEGALEACMRAHPAGRARAGAVRLEGCGERRRARAVPGRVPPPRARLTARGRRVLASGGVLVALGLSAGVIAALPASAWPASAVPGAASPLRLVGERSVVVRPGDTLWSIAAPLAGSDDVRSVVWRIRELNGLRQADLVPGQVLRLP